MNAPQKNIEGELTADVGQAAAAFGSGGDQSLVVSAGGNVRVTKLRITL